MRARSEEFGLCDGQAEVSAEGSEPGEGFLGFFVLAEAWLVLEVASCGEEFEEGCVDSVEGGSG